MKRIFMFTILATISITTSFAESPVGSCDIVEDFGTSAVGKAIFYPDYALIKFDTSTSEGRLIQTSVEQTYSKGNIARIKGYELRDPCWPKSCGGVPVLAELFELDLRLQGQNATNTFSYVNTDLASPFGTFDYQFNDCVFLKSIVQE